MAKLIQSVSARKQFAWPITWPTTWLVVNLMASASVSASDSIDTALKSAVADGHIPGVVAMVANADKVLYAGAFGAAHVAANKPMTIDTIFRIASMTKPVTAVAVMQLVEQGKLALDAPISEYLDDFEPVPVLTAVTDGKPFYSGKHYTPTLRQLLSHTSGFGYAFWNERLYAVTDLADRTEKDFLTEPLVFEPGTRWQYSSGIDWAGEIVARTAGIDLQAYFRLFITEPLGMADTSYVVSTNKQARVATGHNRGDDGALIETPNESFPEPTYFSGGHGLYSTAPDYVRFMQMFLRDGNPVLTNASVAAIGTNQIGQLEVVEMKTQLPAFSNDFNVHPETVDRFGLGMLINEQDIPGRRRAGSLMWAGLRNTYFWIDRTSGLCGVLLTQLLPFYDDDIIDLLASFETAVYAQFGS